jgi:hypothetical protein
VWWRRAETAIDRETVQSALAFLMEMDAKLVRILRAVKENGDGVDADST